jgi:hypothetical protein
MQLLQQPDRITIIYFDDRDSVGYYEGDALVIDTVGVKTDRPFPVVDWYGTPYTQ